jgi:FixJ family two-component response regulator
MSEVEPIVIIVDDDLSVRRSTERLIRSAGLNVQTFASAREFLDHPRPGGPACLVLDVRMPGLSGMDLQRELIQSGIQIPIIFMTGHGDIPMSVRAMKAGAVEFLTKPFRQDVMLHAITQAIERDRVALRGRRELAELEQRRHRLTPREREVMAKVVTGLLNKQMAAELGTSEKTIKAHRARVMQKMEAESLAIWCACPRSWAQTARRRLLRIGFGKSKQPKAITLPAWARRLAIVFAWAYPREPVSAW